MVGFIFGGKTGETATSLKRKRDTIEALQKQIMGAQPKNTVEGIAALLKGAAAGIGKYRLDKAEKEGAADFTANVFNPLVGGSPFVPAAMGNAMPKVDKGGDVAVTPSTFASDDIKGGIAATASSLGIDPVDLATAISYETAGTFDPRKKGPVTQWGQHEGFIQFGEPQAKKYGVNWDDPVGSQLGPDGAVAKYLKDAGVQPGMGMMDIYSAINAGRVGRYNASDADNGGAPGTVADKVNQQMAGHREKALAMFADAQPQEVASLDPSVGVQPMPVERGAALPDPTQPQTASAAIEAISPTQQPGSLSDEVAAFQQTPEYQQQFPGRTTPKQARADSAFVPAEFRNSQQLNTATGGIMPALNGGQPATEQQMAQARQIAQQQPSPQQSSQQSQQSANALGVDPRLIAALSSPFIDPEQKAILQTLAEQQMQAAAAARQMEMKRSDPAYRLDLEKSQLEVDALRNPKPGYRMLTADERKVYGIPDYDTRPYQISKEGQVTAVGGMGQAQSAGVEASQREALAAKYGIDPDSPEGQRFILTGTLPTSDRGVTAGDREAIRDGDDQIQAATSVIDQLQSIVNPNEEGVSLNDRAGSGAMADFQSWAARNDPTGFFDDAKGEATTELNNVVLNQALGSLKSIFGAAPTEGERKILLDMQASVDKTPAERKIIIDKAIKLAQRRLAFNQDRVNELRGGTYYKPDRVAPTTGQAQPENQPNKRLRFNPATGELE